jgi:hypothetical protein
MFDWGKEMDAATQRDDRLVREHEARLLADRKDSVTASAVEPGAHEVSLYEQAIAAAAARRGVSPETIVAQDYEQLSFSVYPTQECLTPDELESIYLADPANLPDWAKDRLSHADTCKPCRSLFASMHPDAESRQRFEQAVGQALAEAAAAAAVASPLSFLDRFRVAANGAVALFRPGSRD